MSAAQGTGTHSLSSGALFGVVAGSIVTVGIVVVMIFCIWRWKRGPPEVLRVNLEASSSIASTASSTDKGGPPNTQPYYDTNYSMRERERVLRLPVQSRPLGASTDLSDAAGLRPLVLPFRGPESPTPLRRLPPITTAASVQGRSRVLSVHESGSPGYVARFGCDAERTALLRASRDQTMLSQSPGYDDAFVMPLDRTHSLRPPSSPPSNLSGRTWYEPAEYTENAIPRGLPSWHTIGARP